jgi:hypothetical protein
MLAVLSIKRDSWRDKDEWSKSTTATGKSRGYWLKKSPQAKEKEIRGKTIMSMA